MVDWEEWLLNNQPQFYHPVLNKYHAHDIARLSYNGRLVKILWPRDGEYLVKHLGTDVISWAKEEYLEPVILWR